MSPANRGAWPAWDVTSKLFGEQDQWNPRAEDATRECSPKVLPPWDVPSAGLPSEAMLGERLCTPPFSEPVSLDGGKEGMPSVPYGASLSAGLCWCVSCALSWGVQLDKGAGADVDCYLFRRSHP